MRYSIEDILLLPFKFFTSKFLSPFYFWEIIFLLLFIAILMKFKQTDFLACFISSFGVFIVSCLLSSFLPLLYDNLGLMKFYSIFLTYVLTDATISVCKFLLIISFLIILNKFIRNINSSLYRFIIYAVIFLFLFFLNFVLIYALHLGNNIFNNAILSFWRFLEHYLR